MCHRIGEYISLELFYFYKETYVTKGFFFFVFKRFRLIFKVVLTEGSHCHTKVYLQSRVLQGPLCQTSAGPAVLR